MCARFNALNVPDLVRIIPRLIIRMTLNAQCPLATIPGVILVIGSLGRVAAAAGHGLPGPRIKNRFTGRMTEGGVMAMTLSADIIDRSAQHGRMVRPMRSMAVITGFGLLVTEFHTLGTRKGRVMTGTTHMTFLPFEQALIIAGMGRMTGHAAIVTITHQVVM